jgi:hypothetical protein
VKKEDESINKTFTPPNQDKKVEAKSCACDSLSKDSPKVALPIVSMYVRRKGQNDFVKTQALLDTGSNRTFCSKSLMSQLKLDGSKTTLALETLGQSAAVNAVEIALEVTATPRKAKKRKVIELPRVYAVESFPAEMTGVSQNDIHRWRHLIEVSDCLVDEERCVSLLIGQDVPQAIVPVCSQDHPRMDS